MLFIIKNTKDYDLQNIKMTKPHFHKTIISQPGNYKVYLLYLGTRRGFSYFFTIYTDPWVLFSLSTLHFSKAISHFFPWHIILWTI